ncbi:hypothetical protein Q7P37_010578 [Cladosporium fusiforme]
MPRKKYRTLDLQQLTVSSRSTSPYYNASDTSGRRDSFSSQTTSDRIRGPLDPGPSPPLELPDSCILTSSSRQALEVLRFGSSSTSAYSTSRNERPSLEQSPKLRILLESDFPPLKPTSLHLSNFVDGDSERRCVTSPEPLQRSKSLEPPTNLIQDHQAPSRHSSPLQYVSDRHGGSNSQPDRDSRPTRSDTRLVTRFQNNPARKVTRRVFTEPGDRRGRNDMASAFPQMSGDARRHYPSGSTRYENRPPGRAHSTMTFHHLSPQQMDSPRSYISPLRLVAFTEFLFTSTKTKSFNVESPSFTPKTLAAQPAQPKNMGISPKAAAAATFTPRGSGTQKPGRKERRVASQGLQLEGTVTPASTSHSKAPSNEFIPQQSFQNTFQEFVPQNFVTSQQVDQQPQLSAQINAFADPFLAGQALQSLDGSQGTINPYADTAPSVGAQAFFQDATSFRHPLNYHLYASLGPRREQITPYQRATSDFFIPDDLREDLQRKAEATLQTFPNSTLPQNVDNHFHSLVALDTVNSRTSTTFGYPSWIYKATSSIDGNTYALRRIEGFRLTSDQAINTKAAWKKVCNGNVVRVHDAFTTQAFGDRSLVIVLDYHPLSQTVADRFFSRAAIANRGNQIVPEQELWSYIVQLANALKAVHSNGLAARTLVPSKVLVTSKNRLRLSGCSVLDIVQFENAGPSVEQQQADLQDLGSLILDIATRNSAAHNNPAKALELVSRSYTDRLRACLQWLLSPPQLDPHNATEEAVASSAEYNVNTLISNISDHVMNTFDSSLSHDDDLTSNMVTELENGRLVRLLTKLNAILERPESSPPNATNTPAHLNQPSNAWSETGERYYLKLFRDYVFHQVDHDGRPVLDLGHMLTCLNKLDAGIDERIQLVSREEQNIFIVSYRELKRGVEAAWGELSRGNRRR